MGMWYLYMYNTTPHIKNDRLHFGPEACTVTFNFRIDEFSCLETLFVMHPRRTIRYIVRMQRNWIKNVTSSNVHFTILCIVTTAWKLPEGAIWFFNPAQPMDKPRVYRPLIILLQYFLSLPIYYYYYYLDHIYYRRY